MKQAEADAAAAAAAAAADADFDDDYYFFTYRPSPDEGQGELIIRIAVTSGRTQLIQNVRNVSIVNVSLKHALTLLRCFIGPILWGHSGPLCHALSLSSLSWTSMRRRRTVAACDSSDTW